MCIRDSVPDIVFYLNVSPQELVLRNFEKSKALDYWESGMDLGLSRDMFDSFMHYQGRVIEQFKRIQSTYGFTIVDANRCADDINEESVSYTHLRAHETTEHLV